MALYTEGTLNMYNTLTVRELYNFFKTYEHQQDFEKLMDAEIKVFTADKMGNMFMTNIVGLPNIIMDYKSIMFNTGQEFIEANVK